MDELLVNSPEASVILLLYERSDHSICVLARTTGGHHDAAALLKSIGGIGSATTARARLAAQDLIAAERAVLDVVQKTVSDTVR